MNVLIIEENPPIILIVQKTLKSYGYTTQVADKDTEVKTMMKIAPIDIVIIGTKLRTIDSIKLCRYIRDTYRNTIIIAINHRGTWQERLELLKKGADDCLNFPFPAQELLVRIQALLRRPSSKYGSDLTYGNIELNPSTLQAHYRRTQLHLTRREYLLLEYLLRNKERAVTRAELLDHVWDYRKSFGSNTVDVHVQKLRSKIRKSKKRPDSKSRNDASPVNDTEIRTVHGIGYKLSTQSNLELDKSSIHGEEDVCLPTVDPL